MARDFRAQGKLCVIVLDYVKPLAEVDAQMDAHVAWLRQGFAHDVLLVAGRQDPRTGGIIVARGNKDEIEALVATDPFVSSGVATASVKVFNASFAVPEIAALVA